MADNFLERHREEYELKKTDFLRKKKHLPPIKHRMPQRPENEAL